MLNFIKTIVHNFAFEIKRLSVNHQYHQKSLGLSDRLPFANFIDPGILHNKDESFTTIFAIKPMDLDASTEDEKAYVRAVMHNAFIQFGNGWTMHFNMDKVESAGYILQEDCHFTDATTYTLDHERRIQYDQEQSHFEDEYVIGFTYKPSYDAKYSKLGKFFITGEEVDSKDKVKGLDLTLYLNMFKDKIQNFKRILGASQFRIYSMSDDDILSYLAYCVNGLRQVIKVPSRNSTELCHVVSANDLLVGSSPKIGDMHIRAVSMGESFPLNSWPLLLSELKTLQFEFTWSSRYIFMNRAEEEKTLKNISDFHEQSTKDAAKHLSEKYGTGESGKLNRAAARYANETQDVLEEIERYGKRVGKYTSTIVIFDKNSADLEDKAKAVADVISRCSMLGKIERHLCADAYFSAIPGIVRANIRKWYMKSDNFSDLLPSSSIWSGYKRNPSKYYAKNNPVLFYAATSGNTPFRGCLHVEDEGHALIIGGRGSKVMNFMAAQQCRYKNSNVIIFDSNHSTLPLAYSIPDSVHYDLGYDESITFKPLEYLDNHEDFSFAVEWLTKLCEVNGFIIKPKHVNVITEALKIVRDEAKSSQRTMQYFTYHTQPKGEDMADLAEQFKPYISTSGGFQGQIFDSREDKLNLKSFTVFEMSHLIRMGDTTLIPAVLYLLHMVERRLDGSPTSIYIHDGFTIFKHSAFRGILDEWLRKIASKNVQIIIGVDQPADIMKSDIADIFMQTCKTKIFTANLNAKGSQRPSYEQMGLNEKQIELISNALVNCQYYFTNPLGSRLIDFNFGDVAETFLTPPQLEEIKIIKQLKDKHKDLFGLEWIKHKKLYPEIAEFWLTKHEELTNA